MLCTDITIGLSFLFYFFIFLYLHFSPSPPPLTLQLFPDTREHCNFVIDILNDYLKMKNSQMKNLKANKKYTV